MTAIVHIVDDDAAFRDSLALMLRLKKFKTAEFSSAEDFLAKVGPDARGCLLADVQMPGMSGLELQAVLAQRGIALPTIIITAYGDVATARAALKGGAVDILEKPLDEEALERIVSMALDRNAESVNRAAHDADVASRIDRLTPREREVLDLVVAGRHNREIAVTLGISPRTVEVFKARMMEKMRVNRIPDLIRLVISLAPAGHST
ncbi:MAG: response regulator transcription factor [Alphaproteobacteria bacterium]|nr:response regulator transcription factor [Alphaproteobacteria bacterium]